MCMHHRKHARRCERKVDGCLAYFCGGGFEVTFCFVYLTLDKGDGCCVGGFAEALR